MLKKPEVGQVVVTKNPNCCGSFFPEGTIGRITRVLPTTKRGFTSIIVIGKKDFWYHCTKCLRRPKKGETL